MGCKIPWNKGLTKETDERVRKTSGDNNYLRKRKVADRKIIYDKNEIEKLTLQLRGNLDSIYVDIDRYKNLTPDTLKIKNSNIYTGYCDSCNCVVNYKGWYSFYKYLKGNNVTCRACQGILTSKKTKGVKKSDEHKKKLSEAAKTRKITVYNENIRSTKISAAHLLRYEKMTDKEREELNAKIVNGQNNKPEHEILAWHAKQSAANVKRIKRLGNESKWRVAFNESSIPIIDNYGKKHNYNFRHALNHDKGEFHIYDKQLKKSYYADAYDEKRNTWLEYDENGKFKRGKLPNEHILREKRIKEILNCKFIRIKEIKEKNICVPI